MLEFIVHKRIKAECDKPMWLVVYCRQEAEVNELGFAQVVLANTQVLVNFSTTRITDEADQSEFEFKAAQYLVEQKELIMGEDGDYYLPVWENKNE
jgi:hypothetical protein